MGEVTRRAFCRPTTPATSRRSLVRRDALPDVAAAVEVPAPELPVEEPAVARVASSEQCACGNVYGSGREVHQELRGGALVAFCRGCVP